MTDIIIVGNSGAAIECHTVLNDMLTVALFRSHYRFKGFLRCGDYKGNLGELAGLEIGSDSDYEIQPDDAFVIGIGDNKIRLQAYHALKERGASFVNLVSPWVYMAPDVQIGESNIIAVGCHISVCVSIGNCNYFNGDVRVGHHAHIGNGNFFAPRSMVLGEARIGNANSLGPLAVIMERARVGSNNKIAPAAILYKGCRDNYLMAGNPALQLETLTKE